MMRNYIKETINSISRTFKGESFNAKKAYFIAQIAKVRKRKEYYLELNDKAEKLCRKFKADWLDKIKVAAKAGKTGIYIKNPKTTLLTSQPLYAKLERKFKKLGYKVERDTGGFNIEWGE